MKIKNGKIVNGLMGLFGVMAVFSQACMAEDTKIVSCICNRESLNLSGGGVTRVYVSTRCDAKLPDQSCCNNLNDTYAYSPDGSDKAKNEFYGCLVAK